MKWTKRRQSISIRASRRDGHRMSHVFLLSLVMDPIKLHDGLTVTGSGKVAAIFVWVSGSNSALSHFIV